MKLSYLLDGLCELPSFSEKCVATGLCIDSRNVVPGDLFIPLRGSRTSGEVYIEEAFARGAIAVVSSVAERSREGRYPVIFVPNLSAQAGEIAARFYGRPAERLQIIGVTGTSGKTSSTHFMAEMISSFKNQSGIKNRCGLLGTSGNGIYPALSSAMLTTADVVTINKVLSECFQGGATYAAMEVSSHALDQERVQSIPFTVGVFTGLTRDHLDYHGTMEAYGAAKAKLFSQSKIAIINADDPFGQFLLGSLSTKKYAFGVEGKEGKFKVKNKSNNKNTCDQNTETVFAKNINIQANSILAEIETSFSGGTHQLFLPLPGVFNLYNALAAICSLCALGFDVEKVIKACAEISPVPGRMQLLGTAATPRVIIDYAHKPDALEKILKAARLHCAGRLICLFGCGGERDKGKRPLMANIAESLADTIYVTDDNPRDEDPRTIVLDILGGFKHPQRVIIEHDRKKAITTAIVSALPADCILIAGKGAENYQIVGKQKIPFNDGVMAQEILASGKW